MAGTIWSWAPGQPLHADNDNTPQAIHDDDKDTPPAASKCVSLSRIDSRWYVIDCAAPLVLACRQIINFSDASYNQTSLWTLSTDVAASSRRDSFITRTSTSDCSLACARHEPISNATPPTCSSCCPTGYEYSYPRTAKENIKLSALLEVRGIDAAFIALVGPDFAPLWMCCTCYRRDCAPFSLHMHSVPWCPLCWCFKIYTTVLMSFVRPLGALPFIREQRLRIHSSCTILMHSIRASLCCFKSC